MIRLNLVLLVALLASALYLVQVQYESRRLYTEIERAHGEARKLEVENERLQVERRAQATPARVERLAREQLKMRAATPGITQYVTLKGVPEAAATPAAPAQAVPAVAAQPEATKTAQRAGAAEVLR
jgi:cell division protein FtsL